MKITFFFVLFFISINSQRFLECEPNLANKNQLTVGNTAYNYGDFSIVAFSSFSAKQGIFGGRLLTFGRCILETGVDIGGEINSLTNGSDFYRDYSLVVGGSLCWNSGNLYPKIGQKPYQGKQENIFANSAPSQCTPQYLKQRVVEGSLSSKSKDAMQNFYVSLSNKWANSDENCIAILKNNGFHVTGPRVPVGGYYNIKVKAADLAVSTYWVFDDYLDITANFIITVTNIAETVSLANAAFPSWSGSIVYNIPGSPLILTRSVNGNLLAPAATLLMSEGETNGYIIVDRVEDMRQSHKPECILKELPCGCCSSCKSSQCKASVF